MSRFIKILKRFVAITGFRRGLVLFCSLVFLLPSVLKSQVINNTGAAINVTAGTIVTSRDAANTTGQLLNNGTINLTGNFTNTATTTADGLFRIGGNWTNTGGIFNPGSSTVIFNGTNNQVVTRAGGETFFNMSVSNTGAAGLNRVGISNIVTVTGTLSMSIGNIDAGAFKLLLSNPLPSALNYTSSTGSRIFGKFERGVNQNGTYLFPLGTTANYNPANLITNSVTTSGTVISEFLTPPSIDSLGLPLPDPPDEVARVFQDGYWNLSAANGFLSPNYNIYLDGDGFTTFPIRDMTRIITRPTGGNWALDGTHFAATGTIVYRDNLTGGISTAGSQYALAQTRPRIVRQPRDTIVCEDVDAIFEIFVTSTRSLTYTWYKEPAIPLTGPHYNTAGPGVLIIRNVTLADAGNYYCIVTDYYGVTVRSESATLIVNKRPVATATPNNQAHECSEVAFDNIVLGETYGVPGTTYIWTRDNPSGITSLVPLSGTAPNIGDFLSGTFTNTTDAPITVTFSITPVGPAVTFCTGQTINAYVTVNPTPRVVIDPVSFKTDICDERNANASLNPTSVKLTTPSVMTMGNIRFDYTVSLSGLPGDVTGNTTAVNNVVPGSPQATLAFTYRNITDTMRSVTYHVIPKVVGLLCPNGITQNPEVKIHPLPLPRLPLSIDVLDPLTCGDGSDSATLRAIISKGAAPYDLLWERAPSGGFVPIEDQIQVNVPSGRYNLKLTDNIGCYKMDVIDVFDISVTGIIYSITKDPGPGHVTCIGDSDGYLYISADVGITYPYNYWLIRGTTDTVATGIFTNNQNYPADPSTFREFNNLPVGKYTLVIRDVNGCTVRPSETLKPPPPMVSALSGTNVSCLGYNDGSAQVQSITGGRGYYKYNWFTTDGFIPGPVNTNQISNLIAGTYYVEIRDTLNCMKLDSIQITQPAGISLASFSLSDYNTFNVSCNGQSDGSISITLAGGSGNFVYNWSGPSGFTATTEDLTGLKAGTYIATINDVSNPLCILMPKPTFTLTEPAILAVSSVKSISTDGGYNINCSGSATGGIDLTVTGGIVSYTYSWTTSNGSGIMAGQEDQSALTAGTYNVVVTDLNTCSATLNNITLTQPAPLSVTPVSTDMTCLVNGSIVLTVTGGVLPYSYSWTGPGGYTSSSQNISNLTQGDYSVTVTDANGCFISGSATINLPPPLSFTPTTSNYTGFNISCYGKSDGSITITDVTGTAPHTFSWTGPAGYTSSSQNISGLVSGTYQLIITDINSCTATGTFVLTDPGKMSMTIATSSSDFGGFNINCRDSLTGTIDITPVNPAGAVTYLWSDGLTGKTRTKMGAGTYQVIILDMNNCHVDSTITLTEPDSIKIGFEVVQAFCPDSPDGQITTTVTGGVVTTDYLYKWDPGNMTTQNLTNILEGKYTLTVTDANGCTVQNFVEMEPQNETCLIIPNAISPNDDNINDIWNIGMIHLYPDIEIRVYNSWGQMVWKSAKGYPDKWDGRSNGSKLPIDSYHYVIDLHNGSRPLVGTITIVR